MSKSQCGDLDLVMDIGLTSTVLLDTISAIPSQDGRFPREEMETQGKKRKRRCDTNNR